VLSKPMSNKFDYIDDTIFSCDCDVWFEQAGLRQEIVVAATNAEISKMQK
jgi:hypothetical protein